jgi:hypothetical protein
MRTSDLLRLGSRIAYAHDRRSNRLALWQAFGLSGRDELAGKLLKRLLGIGAESGMYG